MVVVEIGPSITSKLPVVALTVVPVIVTPVIVPSTVRSPEIITLSSKVALNNNGCNIQLFEDAGGALNRVTSDGLTTDKRENARDAGDCWRQVDAATVITSDSDVVNNQGATRDVVEDTAVGVDGVTGDRLTAQILEVTGRKISRRAGRRDAGEVGKRTESCADCIL